MSCSLDIRTIVQMVYMGPLMFYQNLDDDGLKFNLGRTALGRVIDRVGKHNLTLDPRPFLDEVIQNITEYYQKNWGNRDRLKHEFQTKL